MRNTFFTHGTRNEQFLQQNLVEEYLKMFGMDVLFIPRQLVSKDSVFNEEIVSEFDDSYLIEAYMENFDGFQGGGDLLTKFGIRQSDEVTLVISQQRFSDLISQFLLLDTDIELGERPSEGDLIYFPLTNNYFEIKFVEHEEPFYQLGKNYVYKLKCELFEYSDEKGDIFEGDEELVDSGYTVKYYYLTSPGTSAVASTSLINGAIDDIYLTDGGSKYQEAPTMTITGDGNGAAAEAFLINITVSGGSPLTSAVIRGTVKDGSLRSVRIVDGGSGYDEDRASIVVSSPNLGGTPATVVPTFTNGVLTALNITTQGSNYTSVALVDLTSPGTGYTTTNIAFSSPPAGLTGEFKVPESVTGGTTGATASLVEWDSVEGWIKLKSPTATFSTGETIMGNTSGATVVLENRDEMASTDTKYYENVAFEEFADDILDFTETNPFGVIS